MKKNFHEYGNIIFNDILWNEYILPTTEWFAMSLDVYLLPKNSGSIWECSLAIDFVMQVTNDERFANSIKKDNFQEKCYQTIRWMLSKLDDQGDNWDEAQWDTAVAIRIIVKYRKLVEDKASKKEFDEINKKIRKVIHWLVSRIPKWLLDARYMAGSPDLSQVLQTLVGIQETYNSDLVEAEKRNGYNEKYSSIDQTARILMQMAKDVAITYFENNVKITGKLTSWGDLADTGEVLQGLTVYTNWRRAIDEKREIETTGSEERPCLHDLNKQIVNALRYIEATQNEGHWGSVATTMVTFWSYLVAVRETPSFDYQNHVLFKALRWSCDSNQTLADGSLLHSSYVTVFYALSLFESYSSWGLGKKTISEVYDIALWLVPNSSSEERTKRLLLELELKDSQNDTERIKDKYAHYIALISAVSCAIVLFIIAIAVSGVLGFVKTQFVNLLSIIDKTGFIAVIGAVLTVVLAVFYPIYKFVKKHIGKSCEKLIRQQIQ